MKVIDDAAILHVEFYDVQARAERAEIFSQLNNGAGILAHGFILGSIEGVALVESQTHTGDPGVVFAIRCDMPSVEGEPGQTFYVRATLPGKTYAAAAAMMNPQITRWVEENKQRKSNAH